MQSQKTPNRYDKLATTQIEPESDFGNKEYKVKLTSISEEHVSVQMRYRLEEGNGSAFYMLGVTDLGGMAGLTEEEFKETKSVLDSIAKKHNYKLTPISETEVERTDDNIPRKVYEFHIQENIPGKYTELKVATSGAPDSGKSSLLGTLLSGVKDDGRGSSRLNVFNYPHEVKTGRTSSVAQLILGYDKDGNCVNHGDEVDSRKKSWPEIVKRSSKIVSFFDLCGHEKYLKTTIMGLTSNLPDIAFVLVGANMGMSRITKEHMSLCTSLGIPFAVILSKIDICKDRPQVLSDTIESLKMTLKKNMGKIPYEIRGEDDVVVSVKNMYSFTTVPIFHVSNVTGEGIPFLNLFLQFLGKRPVKKGSENKVEMRIDQTFQVPGVGMVIGGQLISGKIKTGDKLLLGPSDNRFHPIQIRSIQCKRVATDEVDSGCYVCLGIKKVDGLHIRRGHVIISQFDRPVQAREFTAEVAVLRTHSTTIQEGYEPVIHTSAVRQTARIMEIKDKVSANSSSDTDLILRAGDRAKVKFRFSYQPEYVKPGARLLLAEGKVKIIGKVTEIVEEVL